MVCGYVIDESLAASVHALRDRGYERRAPGRAHDKGFPDAAALVGGQRLSTEARAEIEWVIDLITEVRSLRDDLGVPAGAKVPLALVNATDVDAERLARNEDVLRRMGRLEEMTLVAELPAGSVSTLVGSTVAALKIADLIDAGEARKRLDKEVATLDKDITSTEKKLGNADFVARAPIEIVEENRERVKDWTVRRDKLKAARAALEGIGA